ncbi:MAG: glycosyltransferase [Candidatus Bathyarchaeota archaeon]|nr:glycosyltransferase [Candidatus Bathyarchaeota archaeon A05DMB-5]MDH7557304.1 glycosyltransferase [Candidatus Bathyarchaeota archaeon]
MKEKVTIVCDPLLSEYGPTRPPVLIAKELRKHNYDVSLISILANEKIKKNLESEGIGVNVIGSRAPLKSESLTWFYFWLLEGFFSVNSKKLNGLQLLLDGTVLNFSNTIIFPCKIWYAQGPPTVLLDKTKDYLALYYKTFYLFSAPVLRKIDKKMTSKFSKLSEKVFANSKYLAKVYEQMETKVDTVIYPPIDCQIFKPTTTTPQGNYVVTYFGKETNFRAIQKALDKGIKIKAFGGKMVTASKDTLRHPNLEFLGRISDSLLVDLYSNAAFTLFPYIDEPFGYIPVESMACGTPVVTFGNQGPGETVIDGITGWLTNNENEIVDIALKIWNMGYSKDMREECRKRALAFDIKAIVKQWISEINNKA